MSKRPGKNLTNKRKRKSPPGEENQPVSTPNNEALSTPVYTMSAPVSTSKPKIPPELGEEARNGQTIPLEGA